LAPPQRGATEAELRDLERRLQRSLPAPLITWLRLLNGDTISEGGVFGARPDVPSLDIAQCMKGYRQEWGEAGWLPVASDGCGNYYVLLPDDRVGFVEPMADPAAIAEVMADSLASFLLWYLPRK
jgi:cell wall assembly regulator SMI1